ncbi:MAG: hypothetical protein IPL27_16370 [Lewinellaceae bacterium]|nr:hypothetical protein [Lewinellaceae bacterium]
MNSSLLISDSFVRALGWALVHSLWQGACFALILLMLLPKLRTARQRYQASYGALMAVLAAAGVTFCWMFEPTNTVQAAVSEAPAYGPFLFVQYQTQEYGFWKAMTDWLEVHHVLIVLLWLLGFVFSLSAGRRIVAGTQTTNAICTTC